jgi:DNA-binding MarR family transcriptional regulator
VTEVSVRAPTIEDIAAHLEHAIKLDPSRDVPDWVGANLTFGQFRLLFLLRDEGPLSIGALADRLNVSLASASETIDRIARRQLVVRRHSEKDRRVVECQLTDRGRELLEQIAGVRLAGMRRLLSVLTSEELTEFDRLIQLIASRLEDVRAARGSGQTPPGGCS